MKFNKLIQKWLRGDFRRSDEAALRDLAEGDSFARDAVEGYLGLPEEAHEVRLDALRKKLAKQSGTHLKPEKKKPTWWAIAAAFAFLVAAVWFFSPRENKVEMAQSIQQNKVEQALPAEDMAAMTREETNEEVFTETKDATTESASASLNKTNAKTSTTSKIATKPEGAQKADQDPAQAPSPVPLSGTTDKKENIEKVYAGKPYGESILYNQRIPTPKPAQDMAAQARAAKESEAAKKKTKPAPKVEQGYAGKDYGQSAQNSAPPKPVKEAADQVFQTDREIIALEESDDVVDQPLTPEPSLGWEAFRRYIRTNAALTSEALNNNITGTVRLRFQVNQHGEPTNIVVLQSLGYGCDEEAIRLVKEGGIWGPAQSSFVTLDVPFVR